MLFTCGPVSQQPSATMLVIHVYIESKKTSRWSMPSISSKIICCIATSITVPAMLGSSEESPSHINDKYDALYHRSRHDRT